MEHRTAVRISIQLPLELWQGDTHLGDFCATNISRGGLYIHHALRSLRVGDLVTVKIGDQLNAVIERKAMLVHTRDTGMGLMWADDNVDFYVALGYLFTIAA